MDIPKYSIKSINGLLLRCLIRLDLNSHRSLVLSIICERVLKLDRQVFHLDICEKNHEELQVWKK